MIQGLILFFQDYTVSITCTDQLSATGGSYNLHFSRQLPPSPISASGPSIASGGALNSHSFTSTSNSFDDLFDARSPSSGRAFNPHSDAVSFLRHILRQGKLSATLPTLVALLRDTVPVVEVIEEIRAWAEQRNSRAESAAGAGAPHGGNEVDVDAFPKAAGWWRVQFSVTPGAASAPASGVMRQRYGLDMRLMKGERVAILDAARSLFLPFSSATSSTAAPASSSSRPGALGALVLQPIPGFQQIVEHTLRDMRGARIAVVDVAVVCAVKDVRVVGRRVWEAVCRELGTGASASAGASAGTAAGAVGGIGMSPGKAKAKGTVGAGAIPMPIPVGSQVG